MTEPFPSAKISGEAGEAKKKSTKAAAVQVPNELLTQPEAGIIISGIRVWADGLKPKKKSTAFAKPVTRAVVTTAISSPDQGSRVLIGLVQDGTLFDPAEAVKALEAAVNAGVESTSGAISGMSVLLGSIAFGAPAVVGTASRPAPAITAKAVMAIIASHHHAGKVEGCLSRAVAEKFGPVDGWFDGWSAMAMAELQWTATAKTRGRKHVAGIARGITDVIIRCKDVDPSAALPLVLVISTLDATNDQTTSVTIMAQRRRMAECSLGQRLRQHLYWLVPATGQPSAIAAAPAAVASPAEADRDQQLVAELRQALASTRTELADRERSLQKIRSYSEELVARLKIVGEERDAVSATREACEAEIVRVCADVQKGANALADEFAQTQRLKADLATLRSTIDDDLRRQERATRSLMAQRLFEKTGRISEWILAVEDGKADLKGLRETWDGFVAYLRNETNP